jgi:uncharacterized membrane protein YhaH (DUF805 family)
LPWIQKLFGFHGRLNRRDFWLIMLGVVAANWISVLVFPDPFIPPSLMSEEDPLNRAYAASEVFEANLNNVVVGLLLLWPALAASVKRCHDRDRSGVWLLAFWGPALVSGVVGVVVRELWLVWAFGLTSPFYIWPTGPFLTCTTLAFVLWLWGLVELGLLPGNPGSNDYGPPVPSDGEGEPAAA